MANFVLNRLFNNGLIRQLPVLLLLLAGTAAHSQTWQTVVATGDTGSSNVTATATDANGNVYLAGTFAGNVSFGRTTLTAKSATVSDLFVAKWSAAGGSAWVQQAGGAGFDNSLALAVSRTSLYVSGVITLPARFGLQTITGPAGVQYGYLASINDLALATAAPATLPELRFYPNPAHATATVQPHPIRPRSPSPSPMPWAGWFGPLPCRYRPTGCTTTSTLPACPPAYTRCGCRWAMPPPQASCW